MTSDRLTRLKALLDQDPDDSFTHYAIALELASREETRSAIEILEALVQRDPRYVAAYQQLGTLYQVVGRQEQARAVLGRGIGVALQEDDLHARDEMQEALDLLEES